jgi:hypothetical protein
LIDWLYKHNDWIVVLTRISLSDSRELEPPSALARVSAITRVYFPEFENNLLQLGVATQQYELWLKTRYRDMSQKQTLFSAYTLSLQSFFKATMDYRNDNFN